MITIEHAILHSMDGGSQQYYLSRLGHFERVTGRKARGLQMEEIGCKCQTFFYLSLKRQEETNY